MSILEKMETLEYGPSLEDSKEALAWLDRHARRFGHFIAGRWHESGEVFETTDPSTGETLAAIAQGSAEDVDAAVRAARAALAPWQALTPHARARYLYAMA
ncbi:aldehyde dehydrogenase family protein, partial [Acidobacterium sp.]